jgi:uncharacterized phage protein (TIGR01671 family)
MENIKIRAWHEGNHEFIYFTLIDLWKNGWQCCEATRGTPDCHLDGVNDIRTLGNRLFTTDECLNRIANASFVGKAQWELFTGLQDKNGKEIYEGDIIQLDRHLHPFIDRTLTGEVFYGEDGCWYHTYTDGRPAKRMFRGCKVIGNIYENPELLEEQP